jgi:hypothetical protein
VLHQSPFIRLSLEDSSGSAAGVQAWIRSGSTVAQAEGALITFTNVVGALSAAAIVSRHVVFRAAMSPRPDPPGFALGAGQGVFIFSCGIPDRYAIVAVPAIRADFLIIGGPGDRILIDLTAPAVVAFVDELITGGWCNPFGYQLESLLAAFYQWRP